jgi:TolB-like protein
VVAGSVLLFAALAYIAVDKVWLSKRIAEEKSVARAVPPTFSAVPAIPDKSVAVLPFVDMSEKKDQEYFADGMAEEIIDLLSKISGLRVIGRTSSFAFKGKADDLRTIGTQLGAKFVVEGSVRRTADRVRITAQLISTESGSHAWSRTYDIDLGDSLKIQDEIAAQLVRNLQVEVGAADQSPRPAIHNVQAYDSFLRARHARDRGDKQGAQQAIAYYKEAIRLDPSFMPASEGLAIAYCNLGTQGFDEPDSAFERARKQIQIVLAQQPTNLEMHSLLARMHLYERDWVTADQELQELLTRGPNDEGILQDAAVLAAARGRFDDAKNLIGRALAQNPLSPGLNLDEGDYWARAGDFTEAEAQLRHALQISPTDAWARFSLGQVLLARGQLRPALEAFTQTSIPDAQLVGRAAVFYAMRQKSASDIAMRQL